MNKSLLLLALCVMLIGWNEAVAQNDACTVAIPERLQVLLQEAFPGQRLPRASDLENGNPSRLTRENSKPCPYAAEGDFDGDGNKDYAMLLPHKSGGPFILSAATSVSGGWDLTRLYESEEFFARNIVYVINPGTFHKSKDYRPKFLGLGEAATITTEHQGVGLGLQESGSLRGFFDLGPAWCVIEIGN